MQLVLGNIVEMRTDAIAAPAHSDLRPIPGISEAIFAAADRKRLTEACAQAGRCKIGKTVITPSCGLPCRYIIHVVGPGWYGGHKAERLLFANSYLQALHKARAYHCRSVALPLMFSGEFHLPRAQALDIVCRVVTEFERTHTTPEVYLVLYKESIYQLAETVYRRVLDETGSR